MKKSEGNIKIVAKNKKAQQLYFFEEFMEAGIELQGTEVKSIRLGRVNLADAYCKIHKNQEIFLFHANIATYDNGGYTNHNPTRKRRLLLHKREIIKLRTKLQQRGFTLIPVSLYFKRGWAKVELGLAKGKRKADKRESLKQKEAQKMMKNYR